MSSASGKFRKQVKGEAKAQDRWAKVDKAPKVEELKEASMTVGVPLCVYGFSAEDFQIYRRAWQGYAEANYPLNGMCFRNIITTKRKCYDNSNRKFTHTQTVHT